jgi:glycosyltransferase involved in cell wall biosynthesis
VTAPPPPAAFSGDGRGRPVRLDVVVPMWNEESAVELLFRRLDAAFSAEARERYGLASVRYLIVDDGSQDRSPEMVAERIRGGAPAVLLRLSRNFGHQSAVTAGLDHVTADLAAVIDADLQDPPELILEMVRRWRDGFDVVYGVRRKRQEGLFKRAGYWSFYRLVALLSDIKIPLDGGDFCLMDGRVIAVLRRLPEKLRFPRGLRAWVGFRQTGVEYERPRRQAGSTKYTLRRLYKLATDGVISSSLRPLQVAQVASVTYLLVLLGLCVFLAVKPPAFQVPPWILLLYVLILSGNFVQALCIYILGAYVGRTYLEAKGRPPYVVMEVVGEQGALSGPRE